MIYEEILTPFVSQDAPEGDTPATPAEPEEGGKETPEEGEKEGKGEGEGNA